ncbi:MAG: DUF192 domain-containing protein [Elusimicrobiota bacterium]
MKLYNLTKNRIVIDNLKIAEKFSERLKGLLGKQNIELTEGLLIKNCNCIHMFFMKFPIDAVFLRTERRTDTEHNTEQTQNKTIYKTVKILYNIKPWQICLPVRTADSVLEIQAQHSKNIVSVTDKLKIMEE